MALAQGGRRRPGSRDEPAAPHGLPSGPLLRPRAGIREMGRDRFYDATPYFWTSSRSRRGTGAGSSSVCTRCSRANDGSKKGYMLDLDIPLGRRGRKRGPLGYYELGESASREAYRVFQQRVKASSTRGMRARRSRRRTTPTAVPEPSRQELCRYGFVAWNDFAAFRSHLGAQAANTRPHRLEPAVAGLDLRLLARPPAERGARPQALPEVQIIKVRQDPPRPGAR